MFVVAMLNVSEGTFQYPSENLQLKVFDSYDKAFWFCKGLNYFYEGSCDFVPIPEYIMNLLLSDDVDLSEEFDEDGVLII